jgi:Zn-dependent oligopeptidase
MTGISPSEPMVVAAYAVQPFYPIKPMESPPWGQPLEIPAQPTITYTDSSLRPKVEALIAEIDAKIETLEEVGEGVKVEVTVKTLKWCKEKLLKM